jgi:hypothetical protein
MQMENIFKKEAIPSDYFYAYSYHYGVLKSDLLNYLNDNLHDENIHILTWDLDIALTTNANGKYI